MSPDTGSAVTAVRLRRLLTSWTAGRPETKTHAKGKLFLVFKLVNSQLLRSLVEGFPACGQCGKSLYKASRAGQILGGQGPESRSEWSLKQGG